MKARLLSTSALLAIALTGCTCGSSKPDGAASTRSIGAPEPKGEAAGPPLASKEFYRLDLAGTPACKAGTPCDVKIALTALQGHHVNSEYPTKFVPVASPSLGVEGTGSFTIENETRGVMTIKVTPAKAGTHTLDGQFRLSVCTDDKCEIDGPKIAVSIAAS